MVSILFLVCLFYLWASFSTPGVFALLYLSKLREFVMDREAWGRKESDTTEWLNWTELICSINTLKEHIIWVKKDIHLKF